MKNKTLFFLFIFLLSPFFAFSESTFPEEEAGISCYTKLEGVTEENSTQTLLHALSFLESEMEEENIEEGEETHIIGKIPIEIKINNIEENQDTVLFTLYPYIYLDVEGWVVAYFKKDIPTSKIIQWTRYSPEEGLEKTILEEAIEKLSEELNLQCSDFDYYHFEYENADQMAIIIDTVYGEKINNNYAITIPGTIYESSYSLYYSHLLSGGNACNLSLKVYRNEENKFSSKTNNWCRGEQFIYEFYPENIFLPNTPYSVVTKDAYKLGRNMRMGSGTVILYSAD